MLVGMDATQHIVILGVRMIGISVNGIHVFKHLTVGVIRIGTVTIGQFNSKD